jgi:hypothetical protein
LFFRSLMILALVAALVLTQSPVWPGGSLGPGGPYVPGQVDDAGSLKFTYGGSGTPQPSVGSDGGAPLLVCVQSDCGQTMTEMRFLFNCWDAFPFAGFTDAGYNQPCQPLPALNRISKGATPHYMITDFSLSDEQTTGALGTAQGSCGFISESPLPGCDGGITPLTPTMCINSFESRTMDLVTPIPADPNQYLCCSSLPYGNAISCHITGYSTNYALRLVN